MKIGLSITLIIDEELLQNNVLLLKDTDFADAIGAEREPVRFS